MAESGQRFAAATEAALAVTALNLRWDGPDFVHGAFTHPKPENRTQSFAMAGFLVLSISISSRTESIQPVNVLPM